MWSVVLAILSSAKSKFPLEEGSNDSPDMSKSCSSLNMVWRILTKFLKILGTGQQSIVYSKSDTHGIQIAFKVRNLSSK